MTLTHEDSQITPIGYLNGLHSPDVITLPQLEQFLANKYNLDSENILDIGQSLPRNKFDLIKGIAHGGSTNIDWRPEIVEELGANLYFNYNPDMKDRWDDQKHPRAERFALQNMMVVGFYIENRRDFIDGSLGSLIEIDKIIECALIRGQKIVVCFAKGFEKTLKNPGAVGQYRIILSQLRVLRRRYPDMLSVNFSATRNDYKEMVVDAYKDQSDGTPREPIHYLDLLNFDQRKRNRILKGKDKKVKVVVMGASGASLESWKPAFDQKQNQIVDALEKIPHSVVERTNEGSTAKPWDFAYESGELYKHLPPQARRNAQAVAYENAFNNELAVVRKADVVVIQILKEGISQGAASQIGFTILDAYHNGQEVIVYLESFDADAFVRGWLVENFDDVVKKSKTWKTFTPADQEVLDLVHTEPEAIEVKSIKKSAFFKRLGLFQKADNARRTRVITDEQMIGLVEERDRITHDYGITLFDMAHTVEELDQAVERIAKFRKAVIENERNKQ